MKAFFIVMCYFSKLLSLITIHYLIILSHNLIKKLYHVEYYGIHQLFILLNIFWLHC